MTGNESLDDAFKKGTIFAAAGPSEDRAGFHLGPQSPPLNATPRQPRRPHDHDDRAAPRHGLCPRAPRNHHHQGRRPSIQDLDTTSPVTRRYPNRRDEWKGPAFRTPGRPPAPRPNRPAKPGLHRPSCSPKRETSLVLMPGARRAPSCCRARDELRPAAPGARRAPSCSSGRETSEGPQLGEGQPQDRSNARATRRWSYGRSGPTANEPTPEIAGRRCGQIRQTTV